MSRRDDIIARRAAARASRNNATDGCLLTLLTLPWLLLARHRPPEPAGEPPRPDPHPDRLGAHEPSPFRPELTPAPELTRRLHTSKETPR